LHNRFFTIEHLVDAIICEQETSAENFETQNSQLGCFIISGNKAAWLGTTYIIAFQYSDYIAHSYMHCRYV